MDRQQLLWLFFSRTGRLNRAAYCFAGLLVFDLLLLVVWVTASPEGVQPTAASGLVNIIAIGLFFVAHVALAAKRLHDSGKSASWAFLSPLFALPMFVVLCFLRSDPGPNRYGRETNSPS